MFAVTFKNKKTRVNEIEKNIVFFCFIRRERYSVLDCNNIIIFTYLVNVVTA